MHKYKLKNLFAENIEEILTLQKIILETLPNKEYFIPNDKDFFTMQLKNENNIALGLFDNNQLIAYILVLDNCNDYINYFDELNIKPSQNSYNFDIVVVHPKYRNQGIHKYFLNIVIDILKHKKIEEVYCTVHPDNKNSLHNFLGNSYIIIGDIVKPHNYHRKMLLRILR